MSTAQNYPILDEHPQNREELSNYLRELYEKVVGSILERHYFNGEDGTIEFWFNYRAFFKHDPMLEYCFIYALQHGSLLEANTKKRFVNMALHIKNKIDHEVPVSPSPS